MSALVTGASGFLGGHLAEMLIEQGEEVFVLVRSSSSTSHLSHLPVHAVIGDLLDPECLRRAVGPVTRVFHCAACSTDWAPFERFFSANVTGTENLLQAARHHAPKLERFVHVSTTDVYGYPAIPGDEESPLVDAGLPYNQTKRLGELAVWKAHEDGLPVTVVRPATIYGPRGADFTREIAALLRYRVMATIDGGAARGGFTYVQNVARAMLDASVSARTLGQAYNIADGTDATWADYLDTFAAGLGYPKSWLNLSFSNARRAARLFEGIHGLFGLTARPLLTRHAVNLLGRDQEFPVLKARRDFGFAPAISLEEGIARSVAWVKQRG